MRATDRSGTLGHHLEVRIAIVSREPEVRLCAARAFEAAPLSWEVSLHDEVPPEAEVVVLGPDVEGRPGAFRFDPSDPARVVAELKSAAETGRVIAVVGAGGGVGATTLSLHLAREMALRSRTCVLDLDTRWGLRDRLNLSEDALTWAGADGDPAACALPVPGGFRVMLAPTGCEEVDVQALVSGARRAFESVVVDASDGSGEALQHCDAGVLMMAPSAPGARRARAVLELAPEMPWAVVVNVTGPGGETMRAEMQEILGRRISTELPCTAALRDAEGESRLLDGGWSRWQRRVARLARALQR
jgi:pilus assembly protein CpaE